jgi:hypothetical protein
MPRDESPSLPHVRRSLVPAFLLAATTLVGTMKMLAPVHAEFALPTSMADGSQVSKNVSDRGWPWLFLRTGEEPLNGVWMTRTVYLSVLWLAADVSTVLLMGMGIAAMALWHRRHLNSRLQFSLQELLATTALIAAGIGWTMHLQHESHLTDTCRSAAAERCIALLKKNNVWQVDPFNWRIPDEDGFLLEVTSVRRSDQSPELALENMCFHCMTMLELKPRRWRTGVDEATTATEVEAIEDAKSSADPVVRMLLLIGLASSQSEAARDTVVAAIGDPDLGVQVGAYSLVEVCTGESFTSAGCIQIGSSPSEVEIAAKRLRDAYRKDKTFGVQGVPPDRKSSP